MRKDADIINTIFEHLTCKLILEQKEREFLHCLLLYNSGINFFGEISYNEIDAFRRKLHCVGLLTEWDVDLTGHHYNYHFAFYLPQAQIDNYIIIMRTETINNIFNS